MTSRRLEWGAVLILLACATAVAATGKPRVSIVAVGDTLNVSTFFSKQGNVDSVLTTVTSSRTPTASIWTVNSPSLLSIVPSPVLLDGETLTGQSCVAGMVKGKPTASRCRAWSYTRPGVTNDSIVVSYDLQPDTVTVLAGDTVHFLAVATYASGRTEGWARSYWTGGEAGVQRVWSAFAGFTDTSAIRVKGGANEPDDFTAFAQFPGTPLPPFPRAVLVNRDSTWLGRWL